jgi:hypothetical protein
MSPSKITTVAVLVLTGCGSILTSSSTADALGLKMESNRSGRQVGYFSETNTTTQVQYSDSNNGPETLWFVAVPRGYDPNTNGDQGMNGNETMNGNQSLNGNQTMTNQNIGVQHDNLLQQDVQFQGQNQPLLMQPKQDMQVQQPFQQPFQPPFQQAQQHLFNTHCQNSHFSTPTEIETGIETGAQFLQKKDNTNCKPKKNRFKILKIQKISEADRLKIEQRYQMQLKALTEKARQMLTQQPNSRFYDPFQNREHPTSVGQKRGRNDEERDCNFKCGQGGMIGQGKVNVQKLDKVKEVESDVQKLEDSYLCGAKAPKKLEDSYLNGAKAAKNLQQEAIQHNNIYQQNNFSMKQVKTVKQSEILTEKKDEDMNSESSDELYN